MNFCAAPLVLPWCLDILAARWFDNVHVRGHFGQHESHTRRIYPPAADCSAMFRLATWCGLDACQPGTICRPCDDAHRPHSAVSLGHIIWFATTSLFQCSDSMADASATRRQRRKNQPCESEASTFCVGRGQGGEWDLIELQHHSSLSLQPNRACTSSAAPRSPLVFDQC